MKSFVEVERCHLCGSGDLRLVVDLGDQPLANSLPTAPGQDEARYPLRVVRCDECSLLQLDVNVDPEILFSQYVWTTGTSPSTIAYCRALATRILAEVGKSEVRVLEMASNDGTLLREFQLLGAAVLGVDPAANIAAIANDAGVPTVTAFFDTDTAGRLVAEYGPFDVSIARNVMSHVVDPRDCAAALATVLAPDGYAFVEFHSATTILSELHYDSVYHEHTFYHSLHTMSALLREAGLQAVDVWPSPISGGSWVLVARKTDLVQDQSAALQQELAREVELGILSEARWTEFAQDVLHHRETVLAALEQHREGTVVAYGASARSSTVINFWGLNASDISLIADANPLKQGLRSPGAGIPIVSPDDALATNPDCVLIFAFNFVDEIRERLVNDGWHGDLVVPFPSHVRVESL